VGDFVYVFARLLGIRVQLYFRDLLRLVGCPSVLGAQLAVLENGTFSASRRTDGLENALIELADRYSDLLALPADEQRLLYAYFMVSGHHSVLGVGGSVIDRYSSGLDHAQVAALLKIRGRNPAVTCQRKLNHLMQRFC
jgi:hypothetical protein